MNPTQNNKIQQSIKKVIAFKSLSDAPISRIAKEHNCCRNTVYKQQAVAKQAVNAAFDPKPDEVILAIEMDGLRLPKLNSDGLLALSSPLIAEATATLFSDLSRRESDLVFYCKSYRCT